MVSFIKRHWVALAIILVVALIVAHKNCAGCQKRFAAIKDNLNPLNSDTITGFSGV